MTTRLLEYDNIEEAYEWEDVDVIVCNKDIVDVRVREKYLYEQEDDEEHVGQRNIRQRKLAYGLDNISRGNDLAATQNNSSSLEALQ